MREQLTLPRRIIFTGIVALLSWTNVAWDYFHGGVPTHHVLHRADMPGFSNWWGVVVIPLLTWLLLARINRRVTAKSTHEESNYFPAVVFGFLGALLYGIVLSILFTIGSDIPGYMMIGLIIVSFFIPLYKTEHFLGFVLGMVYTFGAILPIIIGAILLLLFVITYKVLRAGVVYLVSKTTSGNS